MPAPPTAPTLTEVKVVGGHGGILSDGARILKPLQSGKRGLAEAKFYADVFAGDGGSRPPAAFMPAYYGLITQQAGEGVAEYLVLEDITLPFSKPSIMDVKMGVQVRGWGWESAAGEIG